MTKRDKPGSGSASRHEGTEQHGWSPDVDAEKQEPNPSARRSFHPDEHAPEPGPGREPAAEETGEVPGDTVESTGRSGEELAERPGEEEGTREHGRRGRSDRPSGGEDASAVTGVDPQDPSPED
jgi:hypothetical protein